MNGKKRYIPIVALGALLLTLLAILPVAAAGEVNFIDPGDINDNNSGALTDTTPDEQEWSRQGGQVGILVDDSDLNAAVKRVLIPYIDTEVAGTADINANSNVITILGRKSSTDLSDREDLDEDTDGEQTVERNDLIMVDYETLRKVTKVEFIANADDPATNNVDESTDDFADVKLTLDRAYHARVASSDRTIHRVKQDYVESTNRAYNAFDDDGYKTLASGLKFQDSEVDLTFPGNVNALHTDVELDRDIVDSGIGSHVDVSNANEFNTEIRDATDKGLAHRLKSAPARGVRVDDVLIVKVDNPTTTPTVSGERYEPIGVTQGGTFRVNGNQSQSGDYNAYVLVWTSEENETGSSVTVRSQAYQSPVTMVLRETTPASGEFAAKVDLIVAEARVSWNNIPEEPAGTVVTLDNTPANDYSGYKVEVPSASRPSDIVDPADATDDSPATPFQKVEFVADFGRDVPRLPVNVRDTISVRHPDDTATIRVETTDSVFSGFSPAHNSSTRDARPELSAQVIDGDSGLDDSKVDIIYTVDDGVVNILHPDDTGYVDEVSGGFAVRARVISVGTAQDRVIKWWVKAEDKAGNVTYSDRQRTVDGENDFCTASTDAAATASDSTCQPFVITVDNTDPNMLRAETGRFWDTSLSTGDSDDKTEYRASEASQTSILVVFNEHLDIGSVQANDFEVNDATPQSADVFNVTVRDDDIQTYTDSGTPPPDGSTGSDNDPDTGDGNKAIVGDSVQDEGEKRGYVFLTVSEMTTNAKPKVELVNNVEDVAGNRRSSGTISEATDRIGPTLTVSFREGDRPVTNKDVTLTVTSDEDIGSPDVRYYRVKSTSEEDEDSVQILDTVRTDAVVNFRNAKEYEVKITPPTDGLYTVFIEADDSAGGNPGTIGDESAPVDVVGDTTAVLFERDKAIAKPDFDPSRDGVNDSYETDDPNGFIRIDYSAEASEYYDAGDEPMVCNQQVVPSNCTSTDIDPNTEGNQAPDETPVTADDLDTYGRLTIVSATLDGRDISGDLNANADGNIFQYHLDGMAVDEYKLEITVRDEAGNQNAAPHKGTVKIIERKPYKLTLNPGWNLVSLPGQPADTDINAVIPADHPVDAVATYDPMAPGSWLTSLESGDGTFDGTVETIEAGLAYWIRTTSFQTLDVDIPKPTPGATTTLLPTIPISQGWNLVPVLDVDGDFELAEQTADDNYFSGLTSGTIAAIYTYDTVTNSWASVTETGVKLGKGYWVYATKPGVIVP